MEIAGIKFTDVGQHDVEGDMYVDLCADVHLRFSYPVTCNATEMRNRLLRLLRFELEEKIAELDGLH